MEKKISLSSKITTHADAIIYITNIITHHNFINDLHHPLRPLFIPYICQTYIFPLQNRICDYDSAITQYKSLLTNDKLPNSTDPSVSSSSSSSLLLTQLPNDVWSCIAPRLHIMDWYNLNQTSRELNAKLTSSKFVSDVSFNMGCDLNEKPLKLVLKWQFYIHPTIRCILKYKDPQKNILVLTLTHQISKYKKIHYFYTILNDRVVNVSITLVDRLVGRIKKTNGIVLSMNMGLYFPHIQSSGFWSCFSSNYYFNCWNDRIVVGKITVCICRHCSKLDMYCTDRDVAIVPFTLIKKIHTKECPCHPHFYNNNNTNEVDKEDNGDNNDRVYQIGDGTQERDLFADGILLNDGISRTDLGSNIIHITANQLQDHKISKYPWFWPWYYYNDISLLIATHFQDSSYHLNMQIVIAKRKAYNKYCFELQIK
jgi:hypothetical protein